MAKVIFFSLPAHGHINPSLAFIKEMVVRGEEVIYYGSDLFRERIEATGASYRSYDRISDVFAKLLDKPSISFVERLTRLLTISQAVVPVLIEEVQREKPDYIIHDSMCVWGKIVAGVLHYPAVNSVPTFALDNRIRKDKGQMLVTTLLGLPKLFKSQKQLKDIAIRLQIPKPELLKIVFNYGELNMVYTSRYFQPANELFDDTRFKFVGPTIEERKEQVDFPLERLNGRLVIYISLGTIFNRGTDFYTTCFEAFKDSEYLVVLSVGNKVDLQSFKEIPENFIVRNYVPQLEVLQRSRLFITHGGMNSVSEAMYYGVPVLVIPTTADQPMVAGRVTELGAGKHMQKRRVKAHTLRQLANEILADKGYAANVALIRESLLATGGPARAAEEFLAFQQRSTRVK